MEEQNKVPMLLEFLFGEVAETAPAKNAGQAQRGASERLIPPRETGQGLGRGFRRVDGGAGAEVQAVLGGVWCGLGDDR